MSTQRNKKISFWAAPGLLAVYGCAQAPPPPVPPPMPPGLLSLGSIWLAIGLLVLCAVILAKNIVVSRKSKSDHLADAVNAINDRLAALEKKIEQLSKNDHNDG